MVAVIIVATASSTAFAAGPTVGVATSSNFGTVLVDAQGFALYTFPQDHNGISACTGPCVPVWPALTVPAGATPTAGTGVPGTVAAVLQGNSTYQVTYNGAPLYTFVGDTKPGQVTGQNIGGFTVVAALGHRPTTPTTAAPAPAPRRVDHRRPGDDRTPGRHHPHHPPTGRGVERLPPAASPATAGSSSGPSAVTGVVRRAPPPPRLASLAFTGPGPGLIWMIAIGSVLIVVSMAMLLPSRGHPTGWARATLGPGHATRRAGCSVVELRALDARHGRCRRCRRAARPRTRPPLGAGPVEQRGARAPSRPPRRRPRRTPRRPGRASTRRCRCTTGRSVTALRPLGHDPGAEPASAARSPVTPMTPTP